jgi:hypothetical protein
LSKLVYGVLFILSAYLCAAVYFDNQAAQQSYQFCQSQAIGNSKDQTTLAASDAGLERNSNQSSVNRWLYVQPNPLPYLNQNACELVFVDGRISQRNFVKS